MPAVSLMGRPMDAAGAHVAGLMLGIAAASGVLLSDLGAWVLAPTLPLLVAGALGSRGGRWAGAPAGIAAWVAAGAVVAPALIAWLRDPPF